MIPRKPSSPRTPPSGSPAPAHASGAPAVPAGQADPAAHEANPPPMADVAPPAGLLPGSREPWARRTDAAERLRSQLDELGQGEGGLPGVRRDERRGERQR